MGVMQECGGNAGPADFFRASRIINELVFAYQLPLFLDNNFCKIVVAYENTSLFQCTTLLNHHGYDKRWAQGIRARPVSPAGAQEIVQRDSPGNNISDSIVHN